MTTKKFKPATDNFPRMFRGGSWLFTSATDVRAAYRSDFAPSVWGNILGFRCAQRGARQPLGKGTP